MLAELGAETFADTFAADNTPENIAMHLAKMFGEHVQRAEIEDPRYVFLVAERAGDVVGYAMLRLGPAPLAMRARDVIEIVRFYAVKRFIGSGVGATLMQHALDVAASLGKEGIWLGVWEHNRSAQAFYRRWGFEDVGSHAFVLGHDRQVDRIYTRAVNH